MGKFYYRAKVGQRTYDVELVERGNNSVTVRVNDSEHNIELKRVTSTARKPSNATQAGGEASPDAVIAHISGSVTAINVSAGQSVSRGDLVATLNSMKMNIEIKAPRDGVIDAVKVAVGDTVRKAQEIASLTPAAP